MGDEKNDVEAHAAGRNVNESVVDDDAQEQKLEDLEVTDEQKDAVKGGLSEMSETTSRR